MPIPLPNLDDRTFADLVEEMRALIPRYAPQWTDHNISDPGIMLIELFAWLTEAMIYRLNRIPEASKLRFLEILGAEFQTAQPCAVELVVTANGLSTDLLMPRGTPFLVESVPTGKTLNFETVRDLKLTTTDPGGMVEARQTVLVQDERLGFSNGEPQQIFAVSRPFLTLLPDDQFPKMTVGGATWAYRSSLLLSTATDTHFTVEPRISAIRFGDGRLGAIPPKEAEIVVSYRSTQGKHGNVAAGTAFDLDKLSPQLSSGLKEALASGVPFPILAKRQITGGREPTSLDEAEQEAITALKTPARAITDKDFEYLVIKEPRLHIVRAKCLPEVDLTAVDPEGSSAGHVSVIVVPEPTITLRHKDLVEMVAFSPDSKRLAVAGIENTVRIWNMETMQEMSVLTHQAGINAFCFSPDSKRLATAGSDNRVHVWDVMTGKEVLVLAHAAPVNAVIFSPDGKLIASASDDGTGGLWEAESGNQVATLSHAAAVRAVAFSTYGKRLATGSNDNTARVWDAELGELVAELPHDLPVNAVVFSPDGERLATRTDDNTTRLWNVATGEMLVALDHPATVKQAILSADARWSATFDGKNMARVWSMEDGKESAILYHNEAVTTIAFNLEGNLLATGSEDNTVRIWEIRYIQDVNEFLDKRRLITCRHHVINPAYTEVCVDVEVVSKPQMEKTALRNRIGKNLRDFFHPLTGGPEEADEGWPFGRDVYASEVYQVIENTEGVDHVEALALFSREPGGDWTEAGDRVELAPHELVQFVVRSEEDRENIRA